MPPTPHLRRAADTLRLHHTDALHQLDLTPHAVDAAALVTLRLLGLALAHARGVLPDLDPFALHDARASLHLGPDHPLTPHDPDDPDPLHRAVAWIESQTPARTWEDALHAIHHDPRDHPVPLSNLDPADLPRWTERLRATHRPPLSGPWTLPLPAVRASVQRALAHTPPHPRILDLAAGAGSFLIAAHTLLTQRCLTTPPTELRDAPRAACARWVATRSLLGVERDPVARHVAQLALWFPGLDPNLPPAAPTADLHRGCALASTSLAASRRYPVRCLHRDGGDARPAPAPTRATRQLRTARKERLKPDLEAFLRDEQARQDLRGGLFGDLTPPPQDPPLLTETWCATWVWPIERLDQLPLPTTLRDGLHPDTHDQVVRLTRTWGFVAWEERFPHAEGGFDVVLGAPPVRFPKPDPRAFLARRGIAEAERAAATKVLARRCADDERWAWAWREEVAARRALLHWNEQDPHDPDAPKSLGVRARDLLTLWSDLAPPEGWLKTPSPRSSGANVSARYAEWATALVRPGGTVHLWVDASLDHDPQAGALRSDLHRLHGWEWAYRWEERSVWQWIREGSSEALRVAPTEGGDWPSDDPPSVDLTPELWPGGSGALPRVQARAELEALLRLPQPTPSSAVEVRWGLVAVPSAPRRAVRAGEAWEADGFVRDRAGRWVRGAWREGAVDDSAWTSADGRRQLESAQAVGLPVAEALEADLRPLGDLAVSGVEGAGLIVSESADGVRVAATPGWVAGGKATGWRLEGAFAEAEPALAAVLGSRCVASLCARLGVGWRQVPVPDPALLETLQPLAECWLAVWGAGVGWARWWMRWGRRDQEWGRLWAQTPGARLERQALLEALVADAYGWEGEELERVCGVGDLGVLARQALEVVIEVGSREALVSWRLPADVAQRHGHERATDVVSWDVCEAWAERPFLP